MEYRKFGDTYVVRMDKGEEILEQVKALALAEHLLGGEGAFRVHGGGFAGTIQAFVPLHRLEAFRMGMEAALGEGMCHVLAIRPVGGACLTEE